MLISLNKLPFLGMAPVDEFGFATGSFSTWTVLGTGLETVLGTELGIVLGTGLGAWLRTGLETVLGTGIATGLGTGLRIVVGAPKLGKSRCPNEGWVVDLWTAFDLEIN